ncbi:DUF4304 domain-containing protein [Micromonospora sp. C31]|uniref:DUF4304 domain-containing protein n=1 Tax=Micromonospora sp. C31 TaxID=2824876 RepID=UPI001B358E32|nr:DUF4304 domain-containing protein [Micromonospora sp. C31]MBQ1073517.1 DUF4304 domain-containing protein [Micromonospora sp. C31]
MTEYLARDLGRTLFKEYLDPVLAERRLAGTGRVYRRIEDDGDALIVEFQRSTSSTRNAYAFFVNVAVVPQPWLLWMRSDSTSADAEPPDVAEGLISTRLAKPNSLWTLPREEMLHILMSGRVPAGIDSGDHDRWWIDSPQAVAEKGSTLRNLLAEKIAEFTPLLDRDVLRERLRSGAPLPGSCPRDAALAVVLADEGPSAELDDVLSRLDDPQSSFVDWVRRYAARAERR